MEPHIFFILGVGASVVSYCIYHIIRSIAWEFAKEIIDKRMMSNLDSNWRFQEAVLRAEFKTPLTINNIAMKRPTKQLGDFLTELTREVDRLKSDICLLKDEVHVIKFPLDVKSPQNK